MTIIEQLKTLSVNRLDFEELILLSALASSIAAEYAVHGQESPDWLTSAKDSLTTEIKAQVRGNLLKRRAEISARLENLRTPEEKKAALKRELKQVEQALGA